MPKTRVVRKPTDLTSSKTAGGGDGESKLVPPRQPRSAPEAHASWVSAEAIRDAARPHRTAPKQRETERRTDWGQTEKCRQPQLDPVHPRPRQRSPAPHSSSPHRLSPTRAPVHRPQPARRHQLPSEATATPHHDCPSSTALKRSPAPMTRRQRRRVSPGGIRAPSYLVPSFAAANSEPPLRRQTFNS